MNKLDTLEPKFKEKISLLLQKIESKTGRKWGISDGRRTLRQQRELYAQGRTKSGKVVTNAQPGSSAHNFGLAVDLWPLIADGKDFDWNASKAIMKQMADLAVEMGLTAGYYFHSLFDGPHVEDPEWKKARALWKEHKLEVE